MGFKDKLVLVTGSGSGIGKATARAFLEEGARMAELTKGTGVRVNAVLPGPEWTEGEEAYFQGLAKQKAQPMNEIIEWCFQSDEPTSLIQRFVHPDEVARMIVTTSANTAANGASYRVEGGIVRNIL